MKTMDLPKYEEGAIIKIAKGDYTTLAKVVDSTDSEVLVFRDTGNIWIDLNEYDTEFLGVAH